MTSNGSPFDFEPEWWIEVAEGLARPWPAWATEADLRYFSSNEPSGGRSKPGRTFFQKRWGWKERAVREKMSGFCTKVEPQLPEITTANVQLLYQEPVQPKPKKPTKVVGLRVFEAWHDLQKQRTGRGNKFTADRKRVLKAAITGGHSEDDLILAIRFAFEYPHEHFLTQHWRNGGYMDLVNLVNRDNVSRNITIANQFWDGEQWLRSTKGPSESNSLGQIAWAQVLDLMIDAPSEPQDFSNDERINDAIIDALDDVGGWRAVGNTSNDYQRDQLKRQFIPAFNRAYEKPILLEEQSLELLLFDGGNQQ
jgi:hypothetical protein